MRGVRRVLADQIDRSIHLLQRHSLADEPVHETRKEMKRARAGLRLLRQALGETAYRRLNRSVRDAARPLTPLRDAKVLRDALDDLLKRAGNSAHEALAGKLHQVLQHERRASRDGLSKRDLDAIRARLQEVQRELRHLPDARLDRAPADAALEQAYKRARKAFRRARDEPSNEQLHEWRKQVKYQFLQLEFAQRLAPKRIGATIERAHRLSDHLGDDHDLALLHEKIAQHATQPHASSEAVATDALIEALQRRRAKLQRKSYRLGKKLYADKPKRVAKRLQQYTDAWQQQTA